MVKDALLEFATTWGIQYHTFKSWSSFSFQDILGKFAPFVKLHSDSLYIAPGHPSIPSVAKQANSHQPTPALKIETAFANPTSEKAVTGLNAKDVHVSLLGVDIDAYTRVDISGRSEIQSPSLIYSDVSLGSGSGDAGNRSSRPLSRRISDLASGGSICSPTSEFGTLKAIKEGSTISELVDYLVNPAFQDLQFMDVFLILYPKFCAPSELLDLLLQRFWMTSSQAPMSALQLRICTVLLHWTKEFWPDFDDKMKFSIMFLLQICCTYPESEPVITLLSEVISWKTVKLQSGYFSSSLCSRGPFYADPNMHTISWIYDVDSQAVAKQLTLIEWEFVTRIQSRDLFQYLWGQVDRKPVSIGDATDFFNFLSGWLSAFNAGLLRQL